MNTLLCLVKSIRDVCTFIYVHLNRGRVPLSCMESGKDFSFHFLFCSLRCSKTFEGKEGLSKGGIRGRWILFSAFSEGLRYGHQPYFLSTVSFQNCLGNKIKLEWSQASHAATEPGRISSWWGQQKRQCIWSCAHVQGFKGPWPFCYITLGKTLGGLQ